LLREGSRGRDLHGGQLVGDGGDVGRLERALQVPEGRNRFSERILPAPGALALALRDGGVAARLLTHGFARFAEADCELVVAAWQPGAGEPAHFATGGAEGRTEEKRTGFGSREKAALKEMKYDCFVLADGREQRYRLRRDELLYSSPGPCRMNAAARSRQTKADRGLVSCV
jgi:hypothetical protein